MNVVVLMWTSATVLACAWGCTGPLCVAFDAFLALVTHPRTQPTARIPSLTRDEVERIFSFVRSFFRSLFRSS